MQRIKVLRNYGGWNTQNQRIPPGEYDIDDPALFGVGEYLLGTEEAIELITPVDTESVIETSEAPAVTPTTKRRGKARP